MYSTANQESSHGSRSAEVGWPHWPIARVAQRGIGREPGGRTVVRRPPGGATLDALNVCVRHRSVPTTPLRTSCAGIGTRGGGYPLEVARMRKRRQVGGVGDQKDKR